MTEMLNLIDDMILLYALFLSGVRNRNVKLDRRHVSIILVVCCCCSVCTGESELQIWSRHEIALERSG